MKSELAKALLIGLKNEDEEASDASFAQRAGEIEFDDMLLSPDDDFEDDEDDDD